MRHARLYRRRNLLQLRLRDKFKTIVCGKRRFRFARTLLSHFLCCAVCNVLANVSRFGLVIAASILAVLVVFRNNVSHSRYNEARLAISQVCSSIRTIATLVHNTTPLDGQDERSAAARPEFQNLCSLLLVRALSPVSLFRPLLACLSCLATWYILKLVSPTCTCISFAFRV